MFTVCEPCGFMGAYSSKIINGTDLVPGEAPWQVAITGSESLPIGVGCGGSLINANWVLTAAHCVNGTEDITERFAVLGMVSREIGGLAIRFESKVVHPDYAPGVNYDFALLKLSTGVNLPEHPNIRPLCWPTVSPTEGTSVS